MDCSGSDLRVIFHQDLVGAHSSDLLKGICVRLAGTPMDQALTLALDLIAVQKIDSYGVDLLSKIIRAARNGGNPTVKLLARNEDVVRLLRFTHLDEFGCIVRSDRSPNETP
jgi:ABC-type transporter Mla MlaB component